MTEALNLLGDPLRRRILEILGDGPRPAGAIADVVQREFTVSQPAVSQHLRALREAGLVSVEVQGRSRIYRLEPGPLRAAEAWFQQLREAFGEPLEALATEIERGKRRD